MSQSLDTSDRRAKLKIYARTDTGRTHLNTMLDASRTMLRHLDNLQAMGSILPDHDAERAVAARNVELLEQALSEVAA